MQGDTSEQHIACTCSRGSSGSCFQLFFCRADLLVNDSQPFWRGTWFLYGGIQEQRAIIFAVPVTKEPIIHIPGLASASQARVALSFAFYLFNCTKLWRFMVSAIFLSRFGGTSVQRIRYLISLPPSFLYINFSCFTILDILYQTCLRGFICYPTHIPLLHRHEQDSLLLNVHHSSALIRLSFNLLLSIIRYSFDFHEESAIWDTHSLNRNHH